MKKVIVITGPTGVGKTDLSLEIAKIFNGEIINADASQFKKDLNIGTAKIDLSKTNVKHHLIDIIECNEMFSISDFQAESRLLIEDISSRGKIPMLVGGSGLYINACLNDYVLDSPRHSLETEDDYIGLSNEELHNILKNNDYEASLLIHPNNRRRVIRAIELSKSGNKISNNNNGDKPLYNYLIICLNTDREILYERINKRCDIMLNGGWIDECKNLKENGINLNDIKDIGYSDINDYLDGHITFEELKETIAKKTRNYAKRQITWMKNKMSSKFVNINYNNIKETINEVKLMIEEFLL